MSQYTEIIGRLEDGTYVVKWRGKAGAGHKWKRDFADSMGEAVAMLDQAMARIAPPQANTVPTPGPLATFFESLRGCFR